MTPYEKFKSLPAVEAYLRPGVTIKKLDDIANQMSDNKFKDSLKKRNHILPLHAHSSIRKGLA
jgi:hypothetical protein